MKLTERKYVDGKTIWLGKPEVSIMLYYIPPPQIFDFLTGPCRPLECDTARS
jgi:hypothetical protein